MTDKHKWNRIHTHKWNIASAFPGIGEPRGIIPNPKGREVSSQMAKKAAKKKTAKKAAKKTAKKK